MTAVLVTRPRAERDPLVRRLEELGYRVHAVATVTTQTVSLELPAAIEDYDWVVVTSVRGVQSLFAQVAGLPGPPRWAAVGPATARALAEQGVAADAVPAESGGAALAGAMQLVDPLGGRRVLLARADAAGPDLPDRLREAGARVDEVTAYRTLPAPAASRPALLAALDDRDLAALVFASGSAVAGLVELAGERAADARRLPAVAIGPQTAAAARRLGFRVAGVASEPTVESLASALAGALQKEH
ncbi:MAG TPA: uroporphyrinogen-III synthase [Candidatus Acidoferrales bacterium]|nr:uroporphyrinogen-III synthase [Candidatus Acidoferrales bacterium]